MAAPFAKAIYNSKNWISCRNAYFSFRNGICERCGAPGKEVHHKTPLTPRNINDPDIVYAWKNLELLCTDCHIMEHDKKKNLRRTAKESEQRVMFDANGNTCPRGAIVIVWGAPASGKTTYAIEHMKHMDVIIDLDRITSCFTNLTNMADDPQKITDYLPFSLDIRDAVYKLAAEQAQHRGIGTVWIVAGLPRRRDRQAMRERFPKARFVHMDAGIEEVTRRAHDDEHRKNKAHMDKVINEYFRSYEAD